MTERLEQLRLERGMRLSEQRRVILNVLGRVPVTRAPIHHRHPVSSEPTISLATVYRALNSLADAGILARVEFRNGKTRHDESSDGHHEHPVDVETGKVLEFHNATIETRLRKAVGRLGYRLLQYRLEIFGASEATADGSVQEREAMGVSRRPRRRAALNGNANDSRGGQRRWRALCMFSGGTGGSAVRWAILFSIPTIPAGSIAKCWPLRRRRKSAAGWGV